MLPAVQSDIWKPATETEKIQALVTLSGLPSRATTAGELDNAAFMTALEGVTRHGLSEAVKAILKGALGHAFLPSPPELRIQCDKAMEWHRRERENIRRRERENAEFNRQHGGPWRPPTAEEKERAARVYADFCKSYEPEPEDAPKLDPELVALVPDNPKSIAKVRLGK